VPYNQKSRNAVFSRKTAKQTCGIELEQIYENASHL